MARVILRGKRNRSKLKAWLMLEGVQQRYPQANLSASELSKLTGVNGDYLSGRLPLWAEWGYVLRHVRLGDGRPFCVYRLSAKGIETCAGLSADDRELIVKLIQEHQKKSGWRYAGGRLSNVNW
ncbi:MAG: hypothetical protein HYX84_01400 [Chloroflexi bacterium]|nr:hypothetical protein [Chloroflexota bacterium]